MADPKLASAQAALNAAEKRKRLRGLGPALKLSDAALDTLTTADVTSADLAGALALWEEANRGTPLASLLEALPVERP